MASRVPEWSYGNCGWTAPRTTECDQPRFNQDSATLNQVKWMHRWNWVILLRCGLQSSVAWNSCRNHLSSPQREKNLCKICPKIVGWRAQMERVATALDFILHYHAEGEDLFVWIITGVRNRFIGSHRMNHRSSG